jgi:hypothetical protein
LNNRRGLYLVRTDCWYLERLVWLVAGVDMLGSTLLAWLVHPLWALSILFVGICSVLVALTGFCIVGNVLYRIGVEPLLQKGLGHNAGRQSWYFMQTDRWFLERRIYLVVGINLSIASVLSIVHSPWWLAFTAFVGTATIVFPVTGYCIMANFLYRIGAEPRLQKISA